MDSDSIKAIGQAEVASAPPPERAERELEKSLSPKGRLFAFVSGVFEEVLATVRARGWPAATALMERRLRGTRALHSRERRLAGDALHQLVRRVRRLRHLAGVDNAPGATLVLCLLADLHLGASADGALPPDLEASILAAGLSPGELRARAAQLAPPVPLQLLGVALSYPDWMVAALIADHGEDEVRAMLSVQNLRAPLTVRANLVKITRRALLERLLQEGISATETPLSPYGLVLGTRANVYGLSSFKEGLMEIMDEGSQLIAEIVAPPPGGVVVDVCAGAGGKTLALSAMMDNRGRVLALDPDEKRLMELRRRARRAGLSNVQALRASFADLPSGHLQRGASRVLVDAPCTGLGVLRRNPEARWRLGHNDLVELPRLQRSILGAAARWVAPHGRLIYATCSVLRRENDEVVEAFLSEHPAFTEVPIKEIIGAARARHMGDGVRLRLLPLREDGPDGFFAAVLRRAG